MLLTTERIQLIHPEGKKAPTMERTKYEALKTAFLTCLKAKKVAPFQELLFDVQCDLKTRRVKVEGKLEWNLFWVTLNLEANKELYKDRASSPIQYSLPKQ